MKYNLIFLSLFLYGISIQGWSSTVSDTISEQAVSTTDSIKQNQYYVDYSDKFALFLYAKKKYSNFTIRSNDLGKSLEYAPNSPLNIGFGFNYKWLGIGIAFNFNAVNNDDDKYGNTKRLDWQTNIYLKKVVIDFYLQNYKGFYLENTHAIIGGEKDNYYIRPDVHSVSLGIGGMYVFNHERFSYKSAFVQTAIQQKSAGSFLLGANIFLKSLNADSSLFPHDLMPSPTNESVSHKGIYVGVLTAYAHNFIIKKQFFISLSMMASIHLGFIKTNHNGEKYQSDAVPVLHLQPRGSFGINKPRWFAGFSFVSDAYGEVINPEKKDVSFGFASGNYRIFLGWRFDWFSK